MGLEGPEVVLTWNDQASGVISNELQFDLPGITSGTYVSDATHQYVAISSITSSLSYQAVNVGSCHVVIGRTPTGGVSGTVDCTVTGGYPAKTWHAKGTFKAEP